MTGLRSAAIALTFWTYASGPTGADTMEDLLTEAREATEAAAVLYVMQGEEVRSVTAGKLHPNGRATRDSDRFAIASVGKIFTSVAILQLAEAGVLAVEDPVTDWLDADLAKGLALSGVTLRHLLTMTSGLVDFYTDDYLDEVLNEPAAQVPETALRYGEGPAEFKPGTEFDYSNTNYVLLQLVLERASGQTMAAYLKENMFQPLGMNKTYVFGTQSHPVDFVTGFEDLGTGPQDVSFYYLGQGFGDGGVISNAEDLASFYHALLVDRTLLKSDTVKMMLTDASGEGYGMGIEITTDPDLGTVYGHSGSDLGFASDIRLAANSGRIAVALFADSQADGSVTIEALSLIVP